jgi:hypothetical protein
VTSGNVVGVTVPVPDFGSTVYLADNGSLAIREERNRMSFWTDGRTHVIGRSARFDVRAYERFSGTALPSPDGRRIAFLHGGRSTVADLTRGQPIVTNHDEAVAGTWIDDRSLVELTRQGTLVIGEIGSERRRVALIAVAFGMASFNRAGTRMATWDKTTAIARIWDLSATVGAGGPPLMLGELESPTDIEDIRFIDKGTLLLVGRAGRLVRWPNRPGSVVWEASDKEFALDAAADGSAVLYRTNSGLAVRHLSGDKRTVRIVGPPRKTVGVTALSPDGDLVVDAVNGALRFYDTGNGTRLATIPLASAIAGSALFGGVPIESRSLGFSPDSSTIYGITDIGAYSLRIRPSDWLDAACRTVRPNRTDGEFAPYKQGGFEIAACPH